MYDKIKYEGKGEFKAYTKEGECLTAGPNIRGMIRYTYFEESGDYPPLGWEIDRNKLMTDYLPKVTKDVREGKIKTKEL